jgi:hypothetical protein
MLEVGGKNSEEGRIHPGERVRPKDESARETRAETAGGTPAVQ